MIFHTHYYIILTCYVYTRYIAEYFGSLRVVGSAILPVQVTLAGRGSKIFGSVGSTFFFCVFSSFQCCFTSTKTIRLIRDGATSTFTQLLNSGSTINALY